MELWPDHEEKARGLIDPTQAAFNPHLYSCVCFAARTTALGVPQMISYPNTNQAHHCLTSVIEGTGIFNNCETFKSIYSHSHLQTACLVRNSLADYKATFFSPF